MQPTVSDMSESIEQHFNSNFVETTDPLNLSNGKRIFVAKREYDNFKTIMHSRNKRFNNLCARLAELYETFIDRIMNSFEVQLSSDSQSQQEYVKQSFPDEKLIEVLPHYVFEEFELDNEYELIGNISAQHNFELPHGEVKSPGKQKKRQRQIQKEIRTRVIESHLHFKSTETCSPD